MKIKILYLYYDLMNLYGESGNIRVLMRHLSDQGIEVYVDKKSICDDLNFDGYDFIYCGSGTESKQKVALSHLMKYREQFRKVVEGEKVILFTGNSFEMLGKSIISGSGNRYKCLNINDFETEQTTFNRITGDVVANFLEIKSPIVGFINKCSEVKGIKNSLFSILMGPGNNKNENLEGIRYKNMFGTHITGPILVKNPEFLKYIIKLICRDIKNFEYKELNYDNEDMAYRNTLKQLDKRMKIK